MHPGFRCRRSTQTCTRVTMQWAARTSTGLSALFQCIGSAFLSTTDAGHVSGTWTSPRCERRPHTLQERTISVRFGRQVSCSRLEVGPVQTTRGVAQTVHTCGGIAAWTCLFRLTADDARLPPLLRCTCSAHCGSGSCGGTSSGGRMFQHRCSWE